MKEESGLDIIDARKVGYLEFQLENKANELLEAHIFTTNKYIGQICETEGILNKKLKILHLNVCYN